MTEAATDWPARREGDHEATVYCQARGEPGQLERWYFACSCGVAGPIRRGDLTAAMDAERHLRAARAAA